MRRLARWLGFYLLRYGVNNKMQMKLMIDGETEPLGYIDILDFIRQNLGLRDRGLVEK